MELFGGYKYARDKLIEYKNDPLILTPMIHSTTTVVAKFENISFMESNLTDIKCIYPIVKIDSNFIHERLDSYTADIVIKETNRGRKKKEPEVKTRKHQGDGTCFNSQTQFTVISKHKRPISDQKSKKDIVIKKTSYGIEVVKKGYKIKLFRNGKVSVPGVLTEDMGDVIDPLRKLEEYLKDIFARDDIHMKTMPFSVKRNYKFKLIDRKFDIIKLHTFYNKWFKDRIITSIETIQEFLLHPVFRKVKTTESNDNPDEPFKLTYDYKAFKKFLKNTTKKNQIYIIFDDLVKLIEKYEILSKYHATRKYVKKLKEKHYVFLNEDSVNILLKKVFYDSLVEINRELTISDNNRVCYHRYKPSKFQGFILKIRTPTPLKFSKKTTIKIFRSGKVNIDGCNGSYDAIFIYGWFNRFILDHEDEIIHKNVSQDIDSDDSDSEFSMTEE